MDTNVRDAIHKEIVEAVREELEIESRALVIAPRVIDDLGAQLDLLQELGGRLTLHIAPNANVSREVARRWANSENQNEQRAAAVLDDAARSDPAGAAAWLAQQIQNAPPSGIVVFAQAIDAPLLSHAPKLAGAPGWDLAVVDGVEARAHNADGASVTDENTLAIRQRVFFSSVQHYHTPRLALHNTSIYGRAAYTMTAAAAASRGAGAPIKIAITVLPTQNGLHTHEERRAMERQACITLARDVGAARVALCTSASTEDSPVSETLTLNAQREPSAAQGLGDPSPANVVGLLDPSATQLAVMRAVATASAANPEGTSYVMVPVWLDMAKAAKDLPGSLAEAFSGHVTTKLRALVTQDDDLLDTLRILSAQTLCETEMLGVKRPDWCDSLFRGGPLRLDFSSVMPVSASHLAAQSIRSDCQGAVVNAMLSSWDRKAVQYLAYKMRVDQEPQRPADRGFGPSQEVMDWANIQRYLLKHGERLKETIRPSHARFLEKIGFITMAAHDHKFERRLQFHARWHDQSAPDGASQDEVEFIANQRRIAREWVKVQRVLFREGKLSQDRIGRLAAAGIELEVDLHVEFRKQIARIQALVDAAGPDFKRTDVNVLNLCEPELQQWLGGELTRLRIGDLSPYRTETLKSLGFHEGSSRHNQLLEQRIELFRSFFNEHGHYSFPKGSKQFSILVTLTRSSAQDSPVTQERRARFQEAGFALGPDDVYFENRMKHLLDSRTDDGNANLERCASEVPGMRSWLEKVRASWSDLTDGRRQRLANIGITLERLSERANQATPKPNRPGR